MDKCGGCSISRAHNDCFCSAVCRPLEVVEVDEQRVDGLQLLEGGDQQTVRLVKEQLLPEASIQGRVLESDLQGVHGPCL